jgi:hypothetical protein
MADMLAQKYKAQTAVVGGAAANLYLNKLHETRDIDVKVCLRDMKQHDEIVDDIVMFLASVLARPDVAKSVGPYAHIEGTVLGSAFQFEGRNENESFFKPLREGHFNLLVLPHDVGDLQTRILVRGRYPIGRFPSGHYKYMEFLDITIPHAGCIHPFSVETVKDVPVLALHDLVREQLGLLESSEFREGGRRHAERASKKKRIRDLLPLLTADLNNNSARRLSKELRGTNV